MNIAAQTAQHTDLGRTLTAGIDADRTTVAGLAAFPMAQALNALGLPPHADEISAQMSLVHRCQFYEALGAIDPNLVFAAPGPGMAGMIVAALGSDTQKADFFGRFRKDIGWSFFAMTEKDVGTDAGAISLKATQVDGGYLLNGEKYLIGQGWRAPIGVVFAKLADGPLGGLTFLIEPALLNGFSAEPLAMFGCRGANLSHMKFVNVFVPDAAVLGGHLRPTERFRAAATATFDALRPCVGAVALGLARGVLDRAEAAYLCTPAQTAAHRTELASLFAHACALSAQTDAGDRSSRASGMSKVLSVAAAIAAVEHVIQTAPASAVFQHEWLRKAWRDVRAFEYAEGVSALHRTQAADLFRSL